ncbi:hypothetical protein LJC24_02180 [Desulfococcaceae bacterium OttesenSCG-928-F15]|nr:hypothetical protein [Desulfococcaceae bacterium OttesenSCG-928-F15]
MERLAADPSQIIPKRPSRMNRSFFMDREMLKILNLVDGEKTLADLASAAMESIASTQGIIKKLLDAGLVELLITSENEAANRSFFSLLGQQLSVAIGPIADLLIEDEIELMGESWKNFPRERMPELVNALARQIPRENARIAFQQNILQALKGIVSG